MALLIPERDFGPPLLFAKLPVASLVTPSTVAKLPMRDTYRLFLRVLTPMVAILHVYLDILIMLTTWTALMTRN